MSAADPHTDDLPDRLDADADAWIVAHLPEMLRERTCPADDDHTRRRAADHGHTDCWFMQLAATEIERQRAELRRLRQQYEWCAGLLGTHDHTGADHMEEAARDAERADRADAALTRLLDAVGNELSDWIDALEANAGNHCTVMSVSAQLDLVALFRRIAAAVEDIDQEGAERPSVCPTCPICGGERDDPRGLWAPCPDSWHGGAE